MEYCIEVKVNIHKCKRKSKTIRLYAVGDQFYFCQAQSLTRQCIGMSKSICDKTKINVSKGMMQYFQIVVKFGLGEDQLWQEGRGWD